MVIQIYFWMIHKLLYTNIIVYKMTNDVWYDLIVIFLNYGWVCFKKNVIIGTYNKTINPLFKVSVVLGVIYSPENLN